MASSQSSDSTQAYSKTFLACQKRDFAAVLFISMLQEHEMPELASKYCSITWIAALLLTQSVTAASASWTAVQIPSYNMCT